jgi:hypothetical protein
MLILQVTLFVIVANLAMPHAHAAPDTIVYMDPAEMSFVPGVNNSLGHLFNVSVLVSDVTDLCSYQIQVRYDGSIIDVVNATEPVNDPTYVLAAIVPNTLTTTGHQYNATSHLGKFTIGGSEYPGYTSAHFNGSGLITIFTFNITNEQIGLSCPLNITNDQTFLLDRNAAKIEPLITENGHYQLVPEFLPILTMVAFMSITAVTLAFRKKYAKKGF